MQYSIKMKEVLPKIFMVSMNSQEILGRTFMRLQEHYESPYEDIKNKIFTRDYFKKIYKDRRGASEFTYCEDWAGYNIPDYIVKHFVDGEFNPLLECETKLINNFRKLVNTGTKFYVIGVVLKDQVTIKHELSHGLWYTNKKYKEVQRKALKPLSQEIRNKINKYIMKFGYCEEVLEDETVAYLLANSYWIKDACRIKASILNPIISKIQENFKKFS